MPDLSLSSVHTFWHDYDRRILYRIVSSMEAVEEWAGDTDPEVEQLLLQIGDKLDNLTSFDITDEGTIVKILASIRLSRALRLMQFLDIQNPGTASKLLVYAEEQTKSEGQSNPYAKLFLRRNLVFERLQLLGRIFAVERVNLVMRAMEKINEAS